MSVESEVMLQLERRMAYIEQGGQVKRCHMISTIHEQTVAAHSFGVAWWCWLLSHENKPSPNLLMAALGHDLPEGETGDIPAPTKRRLGINDLLADWEAQADASAFIPVFELTEDEARILKLADCLELLQHCIRERTLGNRTRALAVMFLNVKIYSSEVAKTMFEDRVLKMLINQWEKANG